MKQAMVLVVAVVALGTLSGMAWAAGSQAPASAVSASAALAPQYVEINSAATGEVATLYVIPAGKRLYLTDLQLLRGTIGDNTDSGGPPLVNFSRKSQGGTATFGGISCFRAYVPMYQNVFFSFRTPLEIKGPDELRVTGVPGRLVLINAFGYLK
jgi:hypothetical protein